METIDVGNDRKRMWLAFIFTTLGWTFDGLDQMIYSMALPWIMEDCNFLMLFLISDSPSFVTGIVYLSSALK